MVAARSLGLEIPRDLSIAVFAPLGTYMGGYELSVAAVPTREMGHRAVRMLLRKLRRRPSPAPESIAYGLVAGGTVGAAGVLVVDIAITRAQAHGAAAEREG